MKKFYNEFYKEFKELEFVFKLFFYYGDIDGYGCFNRYNLYFISFY